MKKKKPEITTRPGDTFPPAGLLANHPRDDLFDDVAAQFEKLEQPLNMTWMQVRNVSLDEVQALSQKIALVLRGYRALEPRDRIAFVTQGVFKARAPGDPKETPMGQRQQFADNEHDSNRSQPDHQ